MNGFFSVAAITDKENSDHFCLSVPFCPVESSAAFASFYHSVQ